MSILVINGREVPFTGNLEIRLTATEKLDLSFDVKNDLQNVQVNTNVVLENVQGDLEAGGNVRCSVVGQNLNAGGNVDCAGDVRGSLTASGNVECQAVGQYVEAGGNVNCGNVSGAVKAGGNIRRG